VGGLEALGVAASIIQIADADIRVSEAIYNYPDGVASADKRLEYIAKNVKLTSEVVRHVEEFFSREQTAKLVASGAIRTAADCAKECEGIFAEIEGVFGKAR
jgi:hypothetical protein